MVVTDAPYRAAVSQRELDAPTQIGQVELTVAPQFTRIELGGTHWTIANKSLTVVQRPKRKGQTKPKRRTVSLKNTKLFVARAFPTNEVSLWMTRGDEVVERVLGLPPVVGFDEDTVEAMKKLDRLARALSNALSDYSTGSENTEFGKGQHRVFLSQYESSIVIYARPVFRERPRRVIELGKDGCIRLPRRFRKAKSIEMPGNLQVIPSGERVQFCHADGEAVASIFLPWISRADREELARRLSKLVGAPAPVSAEEPSWFAPAGDTVADSR